MKIAHFQVTETKSGGRIGALAARIERLRGVVGVVAVRSMGLMTVLYDECRIDPVAISDVVVEAEAEPVAQPVPAAITAAAMPRRREHAVSSTFAHV
jgi:allophanate hydrolase subunit 1